MKRILLRKIFKYDPTFDNKFSRYNGYCIITEQKASPGIIQDEAVKVKREKYKIKSIYCSTLKRSIESAILLSNLCNSRYTQLEELNEIRFSLKELLSEKEFEEFGSNMVRERFKEDFILDKLLEKKSRIKERMDLLLEIFKKLEDGNYIFISHSFFMKLFQIYINHPDLFENSDIINKQFITTSKTFNFGMGFDIIQ